MLGVLVLQKRLIQTHINKNATITQTQAHKRGNETGGVEAQQEVLAVGNLNGLFFHN